MRLACENQVAKVDDGIEIRQFKVGADVWRPAVMAPGAGRGQNILRAAAHNRQLVMHHVRAKGPISRTELAHLTGLTQPGVFKIAKDLLFEDWLVTTRIKDGSKGQPTSLLSINPDAAFSIGANIDRDHVTFVVLDFGGTVRDAIRHDIRHATPDDVRRAFEACHRRLQGPSSAPRNMVGIGVSMPDDFAPADAPELDAQWRATAMETLFGGVSDLPVVRENDAAAAAIGEMTLGAGLEVNTFFYLYLSIGLGGGLVINRSYVRGSHGRSGELGYLPQINPFRSTRTALSRPVERVVSLTGLLDALHTAGIAVSRVDEADLDDGKVQAVIDTWSREAADLLYFPILSTLLVIDPDAILIGGHVPAVIVERLAWEVNKRVSLNLGTHWRAKAVRPGRITANAAAVGAAVMAFRDLWSRDFID